MAEVKIHKTAEMKLKRPTVVLGFPGTGLVGSVAASQVVENLGMKFGGYITSPEFAPLAAIHDYVPVPAARIHYSEKHNLVVILSEMSIPVSTSLELAEKIFEFCKKLNASTIISLGGISLKDGKGVYVVSSDRKRVSELIERKIVKPIREGATTGVTGILLTKGTLNNYPVTTILAESSEEYVDPKAASDSLRVLSRMINIRIDTHELDKEAIELAKSLKESVMKSKVPHKRASVEESGSMYG